MNGQEYRILSSMSQLFTILPPTAKRHITACVGFVSPQDQPHKLVAIKNKRGWDIPGGHVEADELPLDAFKRELAEESGDTLLPGASLIAILESKRDLSTGIAVYRGQCSLGAFSPTAEIKDRKLMTHDELLAEYFSDKDLLQDLLNLL